MEGISKRTQGHEEHGQRNVEVIAHRFEIPLQTIDSSVADVNSNYILEQNVVSNSSIAIAEESWSPGLPIRKGQQVQDAKDGKQPCINPPHQRTLRGSMWRTQDDTLARLHMWDPLALFCT